MRTPIDLDAYRRVRRALADARRPTPAAPSPRPAPAPACRHCGAPIVERDTPPFRWTLAQLLADEACAGCYTPF